MKSFIAIIKTNIPDNMQFQSNLKTIISLLVLFLMSGCSYVQEQSATLKLDKNWTLQPYGEWSDDGQLIKPDVYSPKNELTCDVLPPFSPPW